MHAEVHGHAHKWWDDAPFLLSRHLSQRVLGREEREREGERERERERECVCMCLMHVWLV